MAEWPQYKQCYIYGDVSLLLWQPYMSVADRASQGLCRIMCYLLMDLLHGVCEYVGVRVCVCVDVCVCMCVCLHSAA